jgi:hypothetical protein
LSFVTMTAYGATFKVIDRLTWEARFVYIFYIHPANSMFFP